MSILNPNAGHIFIPSNQQVPAEHHAHRCPLCKRIVQDQPNSVCQKHLPAELEYHAFPCMGCLADWRTRFGLTDLVDALVDVGQAQRFRREWTDAAVEQRERREATVDDAVAEILKEPT